MAGEVSFQNKNKTDLTALNKGVGGGGIKGEQQGMVVLGLSKLLTKIISSEYIILKSVLWSEKCIRT